MMACSCLLAACGARASLSIPVGDTGGGAPIGGGTPGTGGAGLGGTGGAPPDAGPDADAGPDVIVTDAGCQDAGECDDGIPCTLDACQGGLCVHQLDDAACDDGLFCTGVEHCHPSLGCVATPVGCDDGIACTVDACDEAKKGCDHAPDDGLCPISHKCGPGEGCYALAYAHSPDTLYEVRLPSGKVTPIGPTQVQLTDLALGSNATLYGLDFGTLYDVNTTTGAATFLTAVDATGTVAFDVSPQGEFFAGGGTGVYKIEIAPVQTTQVASYPGNLVASGDLAFLGARLLATAHGPGGGNDSLVEIDLAAGTAKTLGNTGFDCIWGLAAFGPKLYGLTCHGQVLNIDTQTGAAQQLSTGGPAFWGASAR